MSGAALFLVVLATLGGTPDEKKYAEAYHALEKKNDGMLIVMLTTDWCPGCREVKYDVNYFIPKHQPQLAYFNYVNLDPDTRTGSLMFVGVDIPQLHVFIKRDGKWQPKQVFTGVKQIRSFLYNN